MKSFANCCQNSHLFDLHLIEYDQNFDDFEKFCLEEAKSQ